MKNSHLSPLGRTRHTRHAGHAATNSQVNALPTDLSGTLGGGLILLADRRILLAGAVANALILLLFVVSALRGDATIDLLSLSGKVAQVLLGVLLVWFVRQMGTGRKAARV